MDLNEAMVENESFDTGADDTLPESIEEVDESNEESLESLGAEEPQQSEEQPPAQKANEPGYVRLRVEKAVQKAVAETERRMRAEFEQQMAPIREKMLTDEARELVNNGKIKDLELAKEYLRMKNGLPVSTATAEPEQPRNSNGQFAPKQQDAGTSTRVEMLSHQADRIKERTGIDVIAEFNSNEEIKKKVINGEMDFYDVAETMKAPKTRKPPAPMRSPNGASGSAQPNAITNMSDEQFERMERKIREGARYSLK